MELDLIHQLAKPAETKIVLLVLDGLGGLPPAEGGHTELEAAFTPNLDETAGAAVCGLQEPVGPGITPGSGPAHLALFGYDPLRYRVGRGVLAALGIGFDLRPSDVAARGNFCTLDENGLILDRRAGRIEGEQSRALCDRLREIRLSGAEVFLEVVRDYRFLLVLRGQGLSGALEDTDPQETGRQPRAPQPLAPEAQGTAELVERFLAEAQKTPGGWKSSGPERPAPEAESDELVRQRMGVCEPNGPGGRSRGDAVRTREGGAAMKKHAETRGREV